MSRHHYTHAMRFIHINHAALCGIWGIALTSCVAVPADPQDNLTASSDELSSRAVTLPPANGKFDYQIGGAYTPAAGVQIVDRDRFDASASGFYNICYLNALQSQPNDAEHPEGTTSWWKTNHSDLLLKRSGAFVTDPGWPGEVILDISDDAKRAAILEIEKPWILGCSQAGYKAIEPDNLDSYSRSHQAFDLDDTTAYMQAFVSYAHSLGLAVAQKNTNELGAAGKTTIGFDSAIAEDCQWEEDSGDDPGECEDYTNVYGPNVIEIEYTDNPLSVFTHACTARGATISIIRRDRDVVPAGTSGYSYSDC